MEHSGLPEGQAIIVVQLAKTQNRLFGETENYLVAREFRNLSTHQEKIIPFGLPVRGCSSA
jgi:hypothetical protein